MVTTVFGYRRYSKQGNNYDVREVATQRLWVAQQQRVDKSKQLHYSLILTQVFMAFQQELILVTVAA